jgi:hypothetical protein
VNSGGSFGCNPLRQEIGLGQADKIVSTEILWPSGKAQPVANLERDSAWFIREGTEKPERIELRKFQYKKGDGSAHHHHPDSEGRGGAADAKN